MPDHLPKETIVHEAPCVCPTCGGEKFDRIGADEREVLECAPSHFKRVVHVRPKMSCRACETIIHAPMPTLPIEKGPPGPALLAHGAVSKFCDHLPLHRQADIYARQGVAIDRSVMAAWMGHLAALLEPLSAWIERHVRAGIAARRRHAVSGARSRQRPDQDREAVDRRARRAPVRVHGAVRRFCRCSPSAASSCSPAVAGSRTPTATRVLPISTNPSRRPASPV